MHCITVTYSPRLDGGDCASTHYCQTGRSIRADP
jgi:hypothetical protein